jgi:hypothetical protein
MRSAPHLYRNRYGIFYFRCIVPKSIRAILPNCPREVRRSLATQDQRLALRKAQVCSFLLEAIFEQLKGHGMNNCRLYLGIQKLIFQPAMLQLERITLDPAKPEEELRLLQGVLPSMPKLSTETLSQVITQYSCGDCW